MLFSIDARPNRPTAWTLSWFLFVAGIALYFYTSNRRHVENPEDKVIPSLQRKVSLARVVQDATRGRGELIENLSGHRHVAASLAAAESRNSLRCCSVSGLVRKVAPNSFARPTISC